MLRNKNNFFKKAILVVILFSFSLSFYPQKAQAALWPAMDPGIKVGLDKVIDFIKGAMLGMLKKQAAKTLNQQVDSLMSGGNDSAGFITDWKQYLINEPKNKSKKYMNDYLSQMTQGRGSSSSYVSEGFSHNSSYAGELTNNARRVIDNSSNSAPPKVTYEGNPSQMFEANNFKTMGTYLSGVNNPWSFDNAVQEEYQRKLREERMVQENKAVAYQGFLGKGDKSGTITNPGSLIKTNVANVQNIGNEIIASATHPAEIIGSFVSSLITKAFKQGVKKVENKSQRKMNSNLQMNKIMDQVINKNGPAARFSNNNSWNNPDTTSNTNAWKNPDTTSNTNAWKNPDAK